MSKLYIYPNTLYLPKKSDSNPYMDHLCLALSEHFELGQVGKRPSKSLFFDIFPYLFKTDYIYFNWIEEIALGKYGFFKFLLYFLMVAIIRLKGVKIIYLLHNKKPHRSNRLSVALLRDMVQRADLLLTHSSEGLEVIKKINPAIKGHVICHPFEGMHLAKYVPENKETDLLIWGTIKPYKGILEFLEYLKSKNELQKYQIRIIGRIPDLSYKEKLFKYRSKFIAIEDKPVKSDLLDKEITRSKVVLFTYRNDTVLSSGVLMQTLTHGAAVVGPSIGAFKDLSLEGLIDIYEDFDSMIKVIDHILSEGSSIDQQKLQSFILNHSWECYAQTLKDLLERS